MSDGGVLAYIAVLAATSLLSLVLTPLALRYALRWQVLDHPGDYKIQESPVPYLGGAAIVLAFALAIGAAALIRPPHTGLGELLAILALAISLSVVGLVDDLRKLGPAIRVLAEVAAGWGLVAIGTGADLTDSGLLDGVLTIAFVVGVTNAFNLLDNMDGLSAGVAGLTALAFFAIAAANGQFLVATLAIALVGVAGGFLRSNFHPARIYMGDAGSLFLGFMLAVIGIKLRFEAPTSITFFVPLLVLGVPFLDTTLVVCTRLLHRRSPFLGGRDHISHRLVLLGLPVPVAVGVIYGVTVSLGWLGFVMSRLDRDTGFILMGLLVTLAVATGLLLGLVPVYESSRRRRVMFQVVEAHERGAA